MKTLLITGATGYIGSWLTRFFIERDLHIIAHGSSDATIAQLKKTLRSKDYSLENVDYWAQDFMKEKWNPPDFSEINYIIHCAALTSVRDSIRENYGAYFTVNVLATKHLAAVAYDRNLDHFISLSSGQVYGKPNIYPINLSTVKEPINMYGFTKLMSEEVVKSFGTYGLPFTIFRPFSVFGPEHSNVISIFHERIQNQEPVIIFGDGTQKRAFTHIKDICNAIALILNNKNSFGNEYNLSGPEEYSINDLITLISQQLGKSPEIKYKESKVNELKRNLANVEPLKELGFRYEHSLEEFIKKM
jgi:UDP-glucose 4-epimerase